MNITAELDIRYARLGWHFTIVEQWNQRTKTRVLSSVRKKGAIKIEVQFTRYCDLVLKVLTPRGEFEFVFHCPRRKGSKVRKCGTDAKGKLVPGWACTFTNETVPRTRNIAS